MWPWCSSTRRGWASWWGRGGCSCSWRGCWSASWAAPAAVSRPGSDFMQRILIVDYGMANLRSVQKAFEKVGHAAEITGDPSRVAEADKLVLPGVGAFRDAIARLRESGLAEPILDHV